MEEKKTQLSAATIVCADTCLKSKVKKENTLENVDMVLVEKKSSSF